MKESAISPLLNWLELPRVRRITFSLFGLAVALLVVRSYYIVSQPLVSAEEFHHVTYHAVAMFPWLIGLGGYEQYGVGAKKIMYLYCLNYLPGLLLGVYLTLVDIQTLRRIVGGAQKSKSKLWLRTVLSSTWFVIFLVWGLFNIDPPPVRNVFGNFLFLNDLTAPFASLMLPLVTGYFAVILSSFWFHLFFSRSK